MGNSDPLRVPKGKLIPRVSQAAKMGVYNYDLNKDKQKQLSVVGDGNSTTVRYNKARDENYYLYILDTYDVNLRWVNYIENYPHTPERGGKAMLQF